MKNEDKFLVAHSGIVYFCVEVASVGGPRYLYVQVHGMHYVRWKVHGMHWGR